MLNNAFCQLLPYQTSFDVKYLAILAIVIAVVVLLRMYNTWRESKKKVERKKDSRDAHDGEEKNEAIGSPRSRQGPDKKDLKYVIETYEFSSDQADFFTRLCNGSKIGNPSKLLRDIEAFNAFCARTFAYLEGLPASNPDKERYKTILFTIRESVERHARESKKLTSTRGLAVSQQITIRTGKDEQYQSSVVENTPEGFVCEVPNDAFGNGLLVPVGAKVNAFFIAGTGDSYQLETKVRRYERDNARMMLTHADSMKALPNRSHERKTIDIPCSFNPVTVANIVNGKRTEHRFYPLNKTFTGILMDISAGGCSISTATPLENGEYLQIQCTLDGKNEETIIAKTVKRHNSEVEGVTVMHIQFAKIPRASMNRVFSFIYNYGEHPK